MITLGTMTTDRPDLDADAKRLRERSFDVWDAYQMLAMLSEEGERAMVLSHFAAAALQAAVRGDIAGLRERGIKNVPVCLGLGASLEVNSSDRLRRVVCTHALENRFVEIAYFYVESGHPVARLTHRLPIAATDYPALPGEVRRRADEIRAFLLHGDLPAPRPSPAD